jgi:hypothetical protein
MPIADTLDVLICGKNLKDGNIFPFGGGSASFGVLNSGNPECKAQRYQNVSGIWTINVTTANASDKFTVQVTPE